VFVTQSSEPFGDSEAWDMAEFSVLRQYRHRGIGTQLAEKVWLHCPGRWQIRVMEKEENIALGILTGTHIFLPSALAGSRMKPLP